MRPIFLPENFNGQQHMQTWAAKVPASPEIKPEILEYLVHMIVRKYTLSDKYEEDHKSYVPLYSVELKRISADYRAHLEFLRNTDVIDIHESYSNITKRTKAYRLRYKYKTARPVAKQLTTARLKRIHNTVSTEEASRMQCIRDRYPYLVNPLFDIRIDREAALQYVHSLEVYSMLSCDVTQRKKLQWRFNMMRFRIERLAHGDISYFVDDSGHRFHSNLTSLNKEIRHFLTYKGRPLGGVDIKNSQPYLSQILLQKSFWEGRLVDERTPVQKSRARRINTADGIRVEQQYIESRGKIGYNDVLRCSEDTLGNTEASHRITSAQLSSINMLLAGMQKHEYHDVTLFLDKINSGLYEYLVAEIPCLLHANSDLAQLYAQLGSPVLDRDYVKRLTMIALYSHPSSRRDQSKFARNVFKHYFPNVYKVFVVIKREAYQTLAIVLQRVEAILVLDRICKEFWKRYHKPVFTIHDGLITTVDYMPKLKALAEDVIIKAIGVNPNLEPELWIPELAIQATSDAIERMRRKSAAA